MSSLLTVDLYDLVRQALDVTLTEDSLPADVIDSPLYARAGRRDVLARDPLAETYEPEGATAAEWEGALRACALFTAARMIPALPNLLSEELGDYTYRRKEWDPVQRAAELRAEASAALSAYLDPTGIETAASFHFTTAPGGRGR